MARAEDVERAPITAIVYADGGAAARLLRRAHDVLRAANVVCAGLLQRDEQREGRSRCDMVLENLQTGERMSISEDRGDGARGCQLNPDVLLYAMTSLRASLPGGADVLMLSKFGKSEAEGGGFRPLLEDATAAGMGIIIGVPLRNVAEWRRYAGAFSREIDAATLASADDVALRDALGYGPVELCSGRAAVPPTPHAA